MRALLLVTLLVTVGASAPAEAWDVSREAWCATPVDVAGQGLSCRAADGSWLVRLDDGTLLRTHGPDALLPDVLEAAPAPLRSSVACVPEDEPYRAHALYVLPPATVDRYADRLPVLRVAVLSAATQVRESALPSGVDVRLRFLCDAEGDVEVTYVRIPTSSIGANFSRIVSDLRAQGFDRADEKYWIFFEGFVFCGCAGQGNAWSDDRLALDNRHNSGPDYGAVYLGNAGVENPTAAFYKYMLHEATHMMGAVQHSAPHASGGFHCNDGADVMCYDDGGDTADYNEDECPRQRHTRRAGPELPYDCGLDDYFNARPPAGSYLATHWNIGSPLNRFIEWDDLQLPSVGST